MENPATWTEAQHVIAKAISKHHEMTQSGFCGLSLPTFIHQALIAHLKAELDKERMRWSDDAGKLAVESCIKIIMETKL